VIRASRQDYCDGVGVAVTVTVEPKSPRREVRRSEILESPKRSVLVGNAKLVGVAEVTNPVDVVEVSARELEVWELVG
jgi:hypothetical protein